MTETQRNGFRLVLGSIRGESWDPEGLSFVLLVGRVTDDGEDTSDACKNR